MKVFVCSREEYHENSPPFAVRRTLEDAMTEFADVPADGWQLGDPTGRGGDCWYSTVVDPLPCIREMELP